jgi:uncharacterized membrane protein
MRITRKWRIDFIKIALGGFSILFLVTFILFWIKGGNQRLAIPIVMLKIFGFSASVLLILGELGHPLFDRVCPRWEKINCQAVLVSPAAKIFGVIPMADLGGVYFGGGIILICFSMNDPHFFHHIYLLAILNLLTLPYTVFSVLYQAFVVKYWCYLCMIVQLLFWLEFWQFYQFLAAGVPRFTFEDFFPILWSFGLPLLIWILLRPVIKRDTEIYKSSQTPNKED